MFDLSKKSDQEKAKFIVQNDMRLKEKRKIHDALRNAITRMFNPRSYNLLRDGFMASRKINTNCGAINFSPQAEIAKNKFKRGATGYTVSTEPFWYRYVSGNPKLKYNDDVKKYLEEAEEQNKFAFGQSTFYRAMPQIVEDGITVGPGVLDPEYDIIKDRIVFKPKSHWLVWFDVDQYGTPAVYHEETEMTSIQMFQKFVEGSGDDIKTNLPQKIQDEAKGVDGKNPFTIHKLIYAVYRNPNAKRNPIKSLDKGFIGYYVLPIGTDGRSNVLIEEKGRDWFPIILRMNAKDGQVYNTNRTLAAEALTTALMDHELSKKQIKLAHLAVEPPLWAPKTLRRNLRRNPNGVTFYSDPEHEQVKKLADFVSAWPVSDAQMSRFDGYINDIFFVRFWELLSDPNLKPINELRVSQMAGEKAVLMSPLTKDIEDDVLEPAANVIWMNESNHGKMPKAPQILLDSAQNRKVIVEYLGPLPQLKRSLLTSKGSLASLDVLAMVGKLFPESMRKVKGDELIEDLPVEQGLKQKYFYSDEDLADLDQVLAQQRQAEQQAELAIAAADAVPKLTGKVEESSVLAQAAGAA